MMNIRQVADDLKYLRMAHECAKASLDPSTKVGGILLTKDGKPIPTFNNFLTLCDEDVPTASREERYADVLHAEESVLLEYGMDRTSEAWYYGTHEPCGRCWKLLAHMGVERVIYMATTADRRVRWDCDNDGALWSRGEIVTRHPQAIVEVHTL